MLKYFVIYMILVNIAGFATYAMGLKLNILAILGGCYGMLIACLMYDKKAVKENMMTRVYIICMSVIYLLVLVIFILLKKDSINLNIVKVFGRHKIFLWYLLLINIITMLMYGLDKLKAIYDKRRISIVTLLSFAMAGGSVGALLGMYAFRHKTKKDYFAVGVPLILVMHVVVLIFLDIVWG